MTLQNAFSGSNSTADLFQSNANLSQSTQKSLQGTNLSGKNLTRINLTGWTFTNVKFIGTHLENSILTKTTFINCDMTGAILTSSTLTGSTFNGLNGGSLQNANMQSVDLTNAIFMKIKLNNADLRNANLKGIQWTVKDRTRNKDSTDYKEKNIDFLFQNVRITDDIYLPNDSNLQYQDLLKKTSDRYKNTTLGNNVQNIINNIILGAKALYHVGNYDTYWLDIL